MKKQIVKVLSLLLVLIGTGQVKAQGYSFRSEVGVKGDTIKIVHNGDTTIIVNPNMKSYKMDTTIVVGNDSTFIRKMFFDTTIIDDLGEDWKIYGNWDSDSWGDKMGEMFDRIGEMFEDRFDSWDRMEEYTNDGKTEKHIIKHKDKGFQWWSHDFSLQLSYGPLSWSRMNSSDDLFSSPSGDYALKFWSGQRWMIGFYTTFFPKSWVSIHTGVLYQSDVFKFRNNVDWDGNGTEKITPTNVSNESKMVARYVDIPLILGFNVGKAWNSSFAIDLGVIGGLNFRTSHTGFKTSYDNNGKHIEESWGTDYNNFNKLKLDAHLGIKWGEFQIYCEQALTPLFKDNKEIKVYPFSFGIMLGL
ncbi:MAG: outer membrane beta-barrel protein [Bacteroidales bacterium]|nr:outer membrane beta-barrel protein [Bacteroidales bacterium]